MSSIGDAPPPGTAARRSDETAVLVPRPGALRFSKLIIQIPCFNEADTLPLMLRELPRSLPGVERVEWLVIDDGSTDGTADVARANGVHHVVRLPANQGLARAFAAGLTACLARGADVIVNADGDNQYRAEDIPRLLEPLFARRADIVIGERPVQAIREFSPLKKLLQRLGSSVVRWLSGTDVKDAPSGFRAMTRDAAMRLHVFNEYTYTLETIIQAGHNGIVLTSVPIRTNRQLRASRLIRSLGTYVRRQTLTLVRIFMTYRPFQFFAVPGAVLFAAGFSIGIRFLYFFARGDGSGHVQSLILGALLIGLGAGLVVVGLVADLISVNRKLLEDIDWRLKRMEHASQGRPPEQDAR